MHDQHLCNIVIKFEIVFWYLSWCVHGTNIYKSKEYLCKAREIVENAASIYWNIYGLFCTVLHINITDNSWFLYITSSYISAPETNIFGIELNICSHFVSFWFPWAKIQGVVNQICYVMCGKTPIYFIFVDTIYIWRSCT